MTDPGQPDETRSETDAQVIERLASEMARRLDDQESLDGIKIRLNHVLADRSRLEQENERLTKERNDYHKIVALAHEAVDAAGVPVRPVRPLTDRIAALAAERDAARAEVTRLEQERDAIQRKCDEWWHKFCEASDQLGETRESVTRLGQAVERLLWQVKITHDAKGEPEPQWAAEIRAALGGVPEDQETKP